MSIYLGTHTDDMFRCGNKKQSEWGGRVYSFANGPGDMGSIPGHVIPKTLKMVLDTPWLNTQQYSVRIKGKLEQS